MRFKPILGAWALAAAGACAAQTKWDLPSGYPSTNFHTENLTQFAADVDKATPIQQALLKAGTDAEARGGVTSKAKNTEYLELLKKNSMKILAPSPQLTADMKKVGETMLQEWLQKAGPEGQAMVDAYRKLQP